MVIQGRLEGQAPDIDSVVYLTDCDPSQHRTGDLIRVPRTPTLLAPLVTTVPLQVLACEIATARGHDVDQPRNLAKSVTVE